MQPLSRQLAPAISARASVLSSLSTARATASAKVASSAISTDCEEASCSACDRRSAAIQAGSLCGVGHDQDLRRAGDQVDADLAEDAALGGGDIGVARPGDLVDRLDRLRAVGQRGHGLRAADAPHLVGAGDLGRQHDQRVENAARRRHDHDDAADARHLGRHDVHQHRGRIGRRAARHVDADRIRAAGNGRPVACRWRR